MADSTTDGISRVPPPRHRDDADTQAADAARSSRPPPQRKPKREFDRVLRDSKKPTSAPPKREERAETEKKGPSLFELSSKDSARAARDVFSSKTTKKKGEFEAPEEAKGQGINGEEESAGSLAQLLSGSKDATGAGVSAEQDDVQDEAQAFSKKEQIALLDDEDAQALAAMGLARSADVEAFRAAEGAAEAQSDLKAVIKQIAEHLSVLRSADKLETLVTLKHPPLFEGATVKLTEHAMAKGQFNLSFNNLSSQARALVDSMQNQDALKQALEAKGFTVHIIQTTEQKDAIIAQMEATFGRQERDAEDQGEQHRRREEDEGEEQS
ncbi:MAG: hypothetical protein KDK78_07545 [Chlamydiia bacterium]|nr:hypothetical protein [Chlamydiia bacterium]